MPQQLPPHDNDTQAEISKAKQWLIMLFEAFVLIVTLYAFAALFYILG